MCIFSTFKCNPRQVCNSKDTCYILEPVTLFEKSKSVSFEISRPKYPNCHVLIFGNWYKITCVLQTHQITFSDTTTVYTSKHMKNYRLSCTPLMVLLGVGRRRKLEDSMHFEIILSDTISHWLPTTPKAQWIRRNNLEFQTHLREDFSILGLF